MPLVRARTPMGTRRHYRWGFGDWIPGTPSTDPNVYTTQAYIKALNLAQIAQEQKQNLLSSTVDAAACWDQFMGVGPAFNPDAYSKCIGSQDVISPQAAAAAAAGVPYSQNVFMTPAPAPSAPPPAPAPVAVAPKPPAQSNAPSPVYVGNGTSSSNGAAQPSLVQRFKETVVSSGNWFDGIPNWLLVAGGVGLGGALLFSRGSR